MLHIARKTYRKYLRTSVVGDSIRCFTARLPEGLVIRLRGEVELLYDQAGLGDSLMVGAVARELKKAYGDIYVTVHRVMDELLEGNPYVDAVGTAYRGIDLNYHNSPHVMRRDGRVTLIETMCRKVGIRNPENRLDMYLTREERKNAFQSLAHFPRPIITIQTTAGAFGSARKHWPQKYWKRLVSQLRHKLGATVIHLGGSNEDPVDGAVNFLGSRAIRDSIAVLEQADLHIGIVSSLMHAAHAVGTKSIILYGGFEPYGLHGYSTVRPLSSPLPCAPCITVRGRAAPCPGDVECMKSISPSTVFKTADRTLRNSAQSSEISSPETENTVIQLSGSYPNSRARRSDRLTFRDHIHTE